MKKLRIAQVSTIWEAAPPPLYGGTERVVSFLTEELVSRGHEVTLFATGDSKTRARLVSVVKHPLYRDGVPWENFTLPLIHLHEAFSKSQEFDIIHIHLNLTSDYISLAFADFIKTPTIFTLHFCLPEERGREWDKYLTLNHFRRNNFVSISNDQRKIKPLNYIATIYNGIGADQYSMNPVGADNLVWLGRFKPNKGTAEAIRVALKSKRTIILAGKFDKQDEVVKEYYNSELKDLFEKNNKTVKYIGEVNQKDKNALLGESKCLLNPINWDEPFGLVVPEANACGTPVVAYARGAMPELIKDGYNGFLVEPDDEAGMVEAVKKIYDMPEEEYRKMRENCRKHVEENFTVEKMVDGYEKVYQKVIEDWKKKQE